MSGDVTRIVEELGLAPHPEGGHYRETWRDTPADGGRGSGTAIYYLLAAGEISAWHRVDAVEIWHFYAGEPLELAIREGADESVFTLSPDIAAGHVPQVVIPARAWQSARPLGAWTLVGCTVSPAFDFQGFEMAPPEGPPGA